MKDIIIEKEDGEYSVQAVLSYKNSIMRYQVNRFDIRVGNVTISLDKDEYAKFQGLVSHTARKRFLINNELEENNK